MKSNGHNKVLIAIFLLLLSACASTGGNGSSNSSSKITITLLIHPEKSDATADYQACSYNNKFILRQDDYDLSESEKEFAKQIDAVKPGWGAKVVSNTSNRQEYDKKVQQCLQELGWQRETVPYVAADHAESNNRTEFIAECLELSKIGDKVDHKLMNRCLDDKVSN